MNTRAAHVEVLDQFQGMVSDSDPSDIPANTLWRQLNLYCQRNGELTTRGGLVELETEDLE